MWTPIKLNILGMNLDLKWRCITRVCESD